MITSILTEPYWETADLKDIEREIASKVIEAEIDEYTRCHPEVRWALTQGDDFSKWFRVRINKVRNGNRYHAPGTGWTRLARSRVARTPGRVLEVAWSPVKIADTPYRTERL